MLSAYLSWFLLDASFHLKEYTEEIYVFFEAPTSKVLLNI